MHRFANTMTADVHHNNKCWVNPYRYMFDPEVWAILQDNTVDTLDRNLCIEWWKRMGKPLVFTDKQIAKKMRRLFADNVILDEMYQEVTGNDCDADSTA